jgi:hypothetical protein
MPFGHDADDIVDDRNFANEERYIREELANELASVSLAGHTVSYLVWKSQRIRVASAFVPTKTKFKIEKVGQADQMKPAWKHGRLQFCLQHCRRKNRNVAYVIENIGRGDRI